MLLCDAVGVGAEGEGVGLGVEVGGGGAAGGKVGLRDTADELGLGCAVDVEAAIDVLVRLGWPATTPGLDV